MSVKRIRWYSIFNLAVLIRYMVRDRSIEWCDELIRGVEYLSLTIELLFKKHQLPHDLHSSWQAKGHDLIGASIPQLIWCKRANPGYGFILVVLACRLGIGFKTVQGCLLYRDMQYVIERNHLHSCIELVALNGIPWSCPTDRSISTISFWGISSITLQIVYVTHMWHKDIGLHQDLRALRSAFYDLNFNIQD